MAFPPAPNSDPTHVLSLHTPEHITCGGFRKDAGRSRTTEYLFEGGAGLELQNKSLSGRWTLAVQNYKLAHRQAKQLPRRTFLARALAKMSPFLHQQRGLVAASLNRSHAVLAVIVPAL
jgi:hypothetical protein